MTPGDKGYYPVLCVGVWDLDSPPTQTRFEKAIKKAIEKRDGVKAGA